ncbi:MAG: GNAT family N-acetyltransferase [Ilumatobacteraceae bacterium]
MNIAPLTADDVDRVVAFFERVPEGDRTFFKTPVLGDESVRSWLDADSIHLVGSDDDGDDTVIGYAAVVPGVGWSRHVGELRVVVDPERRREGIGAALAKAALVAALQAGLSKVVVEAIATQDATIGLFAGLGFQPEALLTDQVRDADGALHDLMVLALHGDQTWATLTAAGLDQILD